MATPKIPVIIPPVRKLMPRGHALENAFAGETIDQERLAHPHAARHEDAALEHVAFVVLDQPRQLAKFLLRRRVRRNAVEIDARPGVFEAHQILAIIFDEPLLARGQIIRRDANVVANCLGEKMLDAQ